MSERSVYKPEEKLKIVLEGMSGTISVSDLCRKYDVKPARFYSWKEKLLKSSSYVFEDRGWKVIPAGRRIDELKNENARLKDVIAEITQENLEIKKSMEASFRGGNGYEIAFS
ncbi:Transposase [Thermoplasmatales archaeon]|nr:Transposase [Thermoplasmatales archaeon]